MKKLIFMVAATLVLISFGGGSWAADCVEVDIELTPEVAIGEYGQGFFELTNCGDEADTIMLSFTFEIPSGPVIEVPPIPVMLGAGETISHDFVYPAPPPLVGYSFELCVVAAIGDAEASDCASTTIVEGSGGVADGERSFGFGLALSANCVELDLEISDIVYTTPGDFFGEFYFELTNCSDEDAVIELSLDIEGIDLFDAVAIPVRLGAGETISRERTFPVPPVVPDGEYTICVTATTDGTVVTDCETVLVRAGEMGHGDAAGPVANVSNFPNPFNPATQIAFTLAQPSKVTVTVVNLLGQQVRALVSGELMSAGDQRVGWDGTDDDGQQLSSGIYFYRIVAGDQSVSEKMILIK